MYPSRESRYVRYVRDGEGPESPRSGQDGSHPAASVYGPLRVYGPEPSSEVAAGEAVEQRTGYGNRRALVPVTKPGWAFSATSHPGPRVGPRGTCARHADAYRPGRKRTRVRIDRRDLR